MSLICSPIQGKTACIIQNASKTIFWLNDKLMQHIVCYTERFSHRCLTKTLFHLHSCSTSCSQIVDQGHLAANQNWLVGIIFPSLMEGLFTMKNKTVSTKVYGSLYLIMSDRWYKFQYSHQGKNKHYFILSFLHTSQQQ